MKRIATMLAAAAAFGAAITAANAAPGGAVGGLGAGTADNPIRQDVRTFCYNRYNGQFMYWGSCRRW